MKASESSWLPWALFVMVLVALIVTLSNSNQIGSYHTAGDFAAQQDKERLPLLQRAWKLEDKLFEESQWRKQAEELFAVHGITPPPFPDTDATPTR